MRKLTLIALVFIGISTSISAKELVCTTTERKAGPSGYEKVYQFVDDSDPNYTAHYLRCSLPGTLACKWEGGGGSPCCPTAINIITADPINPEVIIRDDNNNVISADINSMNLLIAERLLNDEYSGIIMYGSDIQITFSYRLNDNESEGRGYDLIVHILTGNDMITL